MARRSAALFVTLASVVVSLVYLCSVRPGSIQGQQATTAKSRFVSVGDGLRVNLDRIDFVTWSKDGARIYYGGVNEPIRAELDSIQELLQATGGPAKLK